MRYYNKLKFYFYRLDFITFIRVIFFELFTKVNTDLTYKYSFSHAGEDLHIISLLNLNRPGFYIDVGSNHPIRHSNTFKLYLNGWSGLLIDANPILIKKSKSVRKKDISINSIISNKNIDSCEFHISRNSNYSSIDPKHIIKNDEIVSTINLKVKSLNQIIIDNIDISTRIDLLKIDVEGHDYEVLLSINLSVYKPKLIIIEDLDYEITKIHENKYYIYLLKFNYKLISVDKLNLYFLNTEN